MDLTIQQGDLAFAVARALGSVPQKSAQPLLNCLLLEADKTTLRVTGSDLDLTTSVTVPCLGKAPGRVAVNAKHFNEVVRKMPRGAVNLRTEKNQLEVDYGDGKGWSRFPVQKSDEYPAPPELKAETKVTLPGETLARLVERSAYAVSEEPTRASLNGVFLHGNNQLVAFVATDGHRLARATAKGGFGDLSREGVIIPARALATMSRAAAEATSPVEIRIADSRGHAGFVAQVGEFKVAVTARLLEGPYPNYEQVIPKDNPRSLTATRSELMEAVDIVASHADSNTQQVRFSLQPGKLAVSSATADFGAGEQTLAAEYQGEPMDIGYNARYLLQTLRNIPTEKVVFRLKTALSAGIVEPVGALAQPDEELLCLVMPLRLPDVADAELRPVGGGGVSNGKK
jgi:DNA polymerase-3 subunit beta